MAHPLSSQPYTWDEYIALDAQQGDRYEYHDGVIVAMSGATNQHNELVTNLVLSLKPASRMKGCTIFTENVKLFRHRSDRYLYPDLMLTCHPLDLQSKHGVRSPSLIIEVLSKTNTHKELAFKQREYFKLPSLRHYLLVEQSECSVQHFHRYDSAASGDELWKVRFYEDLEDYIDLPEWDLRLSLQEIYAGITFGPELSEAEEAAAKYGVEGKEE